MSRAEFRPAARADLAAIWDHGAKSWGTETADTYVRDIVEALAEAATNPLRGSDRSWVLTGLRKWNVRNHLAYYLLADGGIDVIRILHPRMDVESALDP